MENLENLENLTDEQIVKLHQEGNPFCGEYILKKYKNFVIKIAHAYFIVGCDEEDVIQEGMLGLYSAICTFKKDKFINYASVCIKNNILSAIKKSNRLKRQTMNNCLSIESLEGEFLLTSNYFNPENELINNESMLQLEKNITNCLSGLEREILNLYLQGNSYRAIAENMHKDVKSVNNAMQRIRKKISKMQGEKECRI